MSPADRLPPISPSSGSPRKSDANEPYLHPRLEPELEADAEPPFATMPEVTEHELQADTLAFEEIGRRRPRNLGWLKLAIVLCVVVGGGYVVWHKWGADMVAPTGDEIPTISAAEGPFKIRPETPGGQDIPNRDMDVYDLLEKGKAEPAKGKAESLAPRPEQPLPPPPPKSVQAEISEEGSPQMTVEPGEDDDDTAMVEVPDAPKADAPRQVATPSVVPPTPAKPTPEQVRAAQKPAAPPAPSAGKSDDQVAAVPAPTQPIGAKAYKIQLSAVRSDAAARTEWDKMKKAHPSVLGRLTLNVEKANLGQKGIYYRIQAGPFADRAAADAACQELTKKKAPCIVVRPEG
jgi:cell division septation protein DedD